VKIILAFKSVSETELRGDTVRQDSVVSQVSQASAVYLDYLD